jgi:DNA-binding NtrC family response regulator
MRTPVLIEGASGTGKEALARYIHQRNEPGPFVRMYCGHPDEIAAHGLLRRAAGGTLFLKHIHLLPAALQTRFLAFLESDEFGDLPPQSVRLIASTTASSGEFLRSDTFSADLYFRLSAVRIVLPPLAAHPEQIPSLLAAILARLPVTHAAGRVDARLSDLVMRYSWPGNLRELENFARALVIAADASALIAQFEERCGLPAVQQEAAAVHSLKTQVRHASRRLESEIIRQALDRHKWNRRQAARALQISYRGLLYKMKDLGLTEKAGIENVYV